MCLDMVHAEFQRARTPDQIEQRRSQILLAAAEVIEHERVRDVTLNRIATRCGLAKSNIYRYFDSREAVLLELLSADWSGLAAAIEQQLSRLTASNDAEAVARVMATGFRSRPRFCELNSELSLTLERGVSHESLSGFKSRVGELGLGVANAVHEALPRIPVIRCIWLVGVCHAVAAGLWPMTAGRGRATENADLAVFGRAHATFGENMETAVRALLYGLLVEAARESR